MILLKRRISTFLYTLTAKFIPRFYLVCLEVPLSTTLTQLTSEVRMRGEEKLEITHVNIIVEPWCSPGSSLKFEVK